MTTSVSIIVPVYNEGRRVPAAVESVRRQNGFREVILVDASDELNECEAGGEQRGEEAGEILPATHRVITGSRGRALQMNLGAELSDGSVLLFLHSDTRLPASAARLVADVVAAGACWGRFDIRLDAEGFAFRLIEWAMNARSALTGIATGDQAMFVTREAFDRIGGFPDIPLMEDIELSRRLKRVGKPARIRARAVTSARRWQGNGVWRTIATMWWLRLSFWAGVPPDRLARRYRKMRVLEVN